MVSTLDFESRDPSSSLGGTLGVFFSLLSKETVATNWCFNFGTCTSCLDADCRSLIGQTLAKHNCALHVRFDSYAHSFIYTLYTLRARAHTKSAG